MCKGVTIDKDMNNRGARQVVGRLVDLLRARLGSAESLRGQLVRGGVGSLGINTAHNLLTLAMTVVLARLLGPAGYGVYAYVYSLILVLSVPAQFGLPPLIVRETARGQANMEWGRVKGVARWSNAIAILLSTITILIAASVALYFSDSFTADQLATFAWGLMLMPLLVLGNLRGAVLRGLRKVIQGQLPEKIVRPGLFTIMILGVGFLFTKEPLTASLAMALQAISALLAFLFGIWLLNRGNPVEVKNAPSSYDARRWLLTVFPLALTAGLHLVNTYADILMLGIFGSAEEVGIYRVSVQGAMLVTFGLSAIDSVVAPHIVRLHAQGDKAKLQHIVTHSARFGAAFAFILVLMYLTIGDKLLSWLFGPAYVPGWVALVILSFGRLFNAATGPVVFLLNMTGHERVMARGVAIATVLNIGLNVLLIPKYGMEGAALATAITLLCWNTLLWKSARDLLGVDSTVFALRG